MTPMRSAALSLAMALGLAAAASAQPVFINELHYDNDGADVDEGVEIAGPAGTDLTSWTLQPYNGNGGAPYSATALSGVLPDQQNGYGTLWFPLAGLQNGAPDGVALIDDGGAVVQFLSYEGAFVAVGGPADGMLSTDIGVAEAGTSPVGHSLQLGGTGTTYADFTWAASQPHTNGGVNTGQTFGAATPSVFVDNVSQAEGTGGTTDFVFTISVSGSPAGTVSFEASINDGTATTADSDYVDQNDVPLSIVPPATSTTFTVVVNGDATTEADETFTVTLANLSGADPGDLSGLGTIQNDDITLVPIHDIQGSGSASPMVGASVTTSGVVTSRKSNGFFLQTPDAEADADPMTSEGIFVFTSSAPPASAEVGALVQVAATVVEFVPPADPLQPPLTELSSPVVVQLSTGNPLPTAVPLTPTFPDPAGAFDQMERVEGMRVSAASLTVVGPTLGNVNEPNATATTNGVFFATVTGHPRPVREPGVQEPDPAPGTVPRFDTNPESIRVDSDAGGHAAIDAGAGALLGGVSGPVDYAFRKYTIVPEAGAVITVDGGPTATPVTLPESVELTIASYNLERFFDDVNDPSIGEPVLTPLAFDGRLGRASLGIRDFLGTPDIVGVVEVENLSTLQALAARISADAIADGQPDPLYTAQLVEGNDVGGIDVGFLVKTAPVGAAPRVEVVEVVQELAGTLFVNPDLSTELLNDRPPLRLAAIVHFGGGDSWPVTVIVNHLRSLNGAASPAPGSNGWSTVGDRVRAKRLAQAEDLADLVQARQVADPEENIVLIGDFNAFEVNDGLVHSMGVIAGTPVPDDQTVVPGDGVDLVTPDFALVNAGEYSFVFDGNAQSLDHALVGAGVLNSTAEFRVEHGRINADFPEVARNAAGVVERLSDHDPLVLYLTPSILVSQLPFFGDFETGDLTQWSAALP